MNLTAGKIISSLVGGGSLLLGVATAIYGLSMVLVGFSGGLPVTLAGVLFIFAGSVTFPWTRPYVSAYTRVEFSGGAIATIMLLSIVLSPALALTGGLMYNPSTVPADSSSTTSDQTTPSAVDDAPPVTVTSENVDSNRSNILHVEYHGRAQYTVDPDPDTLSSYSSDDGNKYVVVRLELTNNGSSEIDLRNSMFRIDVDGVVRDSVNLFGADGGLSGTSLRPEATTKAWIVFSVPEDAEDTTILADLTYYDTHGIVFSQNQSLAIDMAA